MAKNRQNQPKQSSQTNNMNPTSTGAITPQEAGKLGGEKGGKAPHSCRGFECQQKDQSSGTKSKNKNNKNNR